MRANDLQDARKGPHSSGEILPGVYFGRLMRPDQVAAATASQPDVVKGAVGQCWAICGDLSKEVFRWLEMSGRCQHAVERLTAFVSPAGGNYAVLTQQVAGFQNRFLLPLYEPSIRLFVTEIGRSSLAYSLGCDRGSEALVWRSQIAASGILPLQALSAPLRGHQQVEVMREYGLVVQQMTVPGQIPSITTGEVVQHVSLTLLPPGETLLQCSEAVSGGSL